MSSSSDCITRNIRVRATPAYLPERSDPASDTFLFAYRITIDNQGSETVQLRSRHWVIINADGIRDEVSGEGVIGETPRIAPGATYTYASFCPLSTHWGTMEGSYQFVGEAGDTFDVEIGRFLLVAPVTSGTEVTR